MTKKYILLVSIIFLSMTPSYSFWQDDYVKSIVNMDVTYSNHSYLQPWQKKSPKTRSGQAVAIGPNRLLAIASIIQNSDLIEIQTAYQSNSIPAKVKLVDYDVNLCILEVDEKELVEPFKPISISKKIDPDSKLTLLWLTRSKRFIKTSGKIEFPDVNIYTKMKAAFLVYSISSESSPEGFSEAVFQNGSLIGLVESFDSNKKSSILLTHKVIFQFLKRAALPAYKSVPRFGFEPANLTDKSSRRFFKIPKDEKRGLYVSEVFDFGTGSTDLKKNDIILKIQKYDIDPLGNINHKLFGKLPFWYLISEREVGENLDFTLLRNGKLLKKKIECTTFSSNDITIPYFNYDNPPDYIVMGGFIFQELNWDYVLEFGKEWESRLDPLLHLNLTKNGYKKLKDKNRIVILNQVLPHPVNQGYQHLRNKILTKINGTLVKDISHARKLFNTAMDRDYIKLEFDGFTVDVIIPTKKLMDINAEIKKIFGIN